MEQQAWLKPWLVSCSQAWEWCIPPLILCMGRIKQRGQVTFPKSHSKLRSKHSRRPVRNPVWKECGLSEKIDNTRRTWLIESTKHSSHGLTETETASIGPARVCTRSSVWMLWLLAWSSWWGSYEWKTVWPAFGNVFLLLGCLFHHLYDGFCLVLLYLVISCLTLLS